MNMEVEKGVSLEDQLMGQSDFFKYQEDLIANALTTVDEGAVFPDLEDGQKIGFVLTELDPADRESIRDDGDLIRKIDSALAMAQEKMRNLDQSSYADWLESEARRERLVDQLQNKDEAPRNPAERSTWIRDQKKKIENEKRSTTYGRCVNDIARFSAAREAIDRHYNPKTAEKPEQKRDRVAA